MWESWLFGSLLVVLAIGLMWRSHRDRQDRVGLPLEVREHPYFVRLQVRRQYINSALLLIGLLIIVSSMVLSVLALVILWTVVMLLACTVGWLAMADLRSSRGYLEELEAQHQVAYGKLKDELERFQQENAEVNPEANGRRQDSQ